MPRSIPSTAKYIKRLCTISFHCCGGAVSLFPLGYLSPRLLRGISPRISCALGAPTYIYISTYFRGCRIYLRQPGVLSLVPSGYELPLAPFFVRGTGFLSIFLRIFSTSFLFSGGHIVCLSSGYLFLFPEGCTSPLLSSPSVLRSCYFLRDVFCILRGDFLF